MNKKFSNTISLKNATVTANWELNQSKAGTACFTGLLEKKSFLCK